VKLHPPLMAMALGVLGYVAWSCSSADEVVGGPTLVTLTCTITDAGATNYAVASFPGASWEEIVAEVHGVGSAGCVFPVTEAGAPEDGGDAGGDAGDAGDDAGDAGDDADTGDDAGDSGSEDAGDGTGGSGSEDAGSEDAGVVDAGDDAGDAASKDAGTSGSTGGSGGAEAGQSLIPGFNDPSDLYSVDALPDGGVAYVPCCAGSTTVTILVGGNLPTTGL
jgi:hypothetical protein